LNLLIEDNGKGIEISKKNKGIGLRNIKQRVESLNGTLDIDSEQGMGTTLNILIPFN
jgi:signal transduction histidine kinase